MKSKKLLIIDFDGPINELTAAKETTIKILAEKLDIKFSELATNSLLVYIDQIYENERIIEYQTIIKKALKILVKNNLITLDKNQAEEFSKLFANTLYENLVLNTKFLTSLERLKKKKEHVLCIYSTQSKQIIQNLLGKQIALFDKVFVNDDFDEPKPSVNNLLIICEQFKIKPSKATMIGDNIVVDLMPAKYLGMHTILYSSLVDTTSNNLGDLDKLL